MVRAVFLAFIVAIALHGLRLFLIPGFVSMNSLLGLIVREKLWPQPIFFSVYTYESVLCVFVGV